MKRARGVVADLCVALEFLHDRRGLIHRDVKPENLFLGADGVTRLGDFGLATTTSQGRMTPQMVTLWYRAPEILLGSTAYGQEVDMWSVGAVFSELLLGAPLFKGTTELETLNLIFRAVGRPTRAEWPDMEELGAWLCEEEGEDVGPAGGAGACEGGGGCLRAELERAAQEEGGGGPEWQDGMDFIERLLTPNPDNRLSAREALDHPFIRDETRVQLWRAAALPSPERAAAEVHRSPLVANPLRRVSAFSKTDSAINKRRRIR